jgi:hypothetical protein
MNRFVLTIILGFVASFTFAQDKCDSGYFIVSEGNYLKMTVDKITRTLKTLDKECIENNAEYGEVLNEYVFNCLAFCSDTLLTVLEKNKCQPFYDMILNEVANPVSDIHEFKAIYCNIKNYKKGKKSKPRDELLTNFEKGIVDILPNYEEVKNSSCGK